MILKFILSTFLISFISAQSRANMTESGQVNKMIFDSVASSPAFISRTQLAMYFAQILYETNGLSINQAMPCSRLGSRSACSDYIAKRVNNTGAYCGCTDYRGRGRLMVEDADTYKSVSNALFNNDILFEHPDHVQKYPQVAWATAAWNWATNVGALIGSSDAFGLTTKFLRPNDCYSNTETSDESSTAFNIYQQVLSIFDPDRVANPAGCVPNRK